MAAMVSWMLIAVVVVFVVVAIVVGGRRRISSGPQALDTNTNYRIMEAQANSIRNQTSGF